MAYPAVEAKSLSTLTTLASNPPAYPRNPTHVRHEPLVLYIARVPGSKDVFLSPMKPREKVVTAEDIQSSLYFIHVNQPEDVRLVEPPTFGQEPPLPSNPVARKAVPGAAPPGGLAPLAPRRKPVPGTLAPVNDFENRQNIGASNYSQNLYPGHGPEYSQRTSFESGNYAEPEERPPLPPRMPTGSPAASTTLTLIRRDPASDSQWNVAYIEDPPVYDLSSSTLNEPMTKNKYGAPFYIEVTNPGYSKFLNNPEKQELLRQSTELSNRMSQLGAPSANYNPYMPPSIPATSSDIRGGADQREETFRRRVWMEGSKHRSRSSHDFSAGRDSQRSSGEAYSGDFRVAGPPSPMVHDDKQPGFRGYVFKSPWNGRCEFITGVSGDTLKCRHILSGLQGAAPLAMPVSEMRFNLPSSTKGEDTSKRSSIFHRPKHNRSHSGVSEMDLSLGQEFAGGGYGGKQAKLGKLIIEDEGLKMLDLLVAANMALWWRAYERIDSKYRA